jgi:predicted outer membrane protein
LQLAQAVKQECINLTQQELANKQGADFDKAYMGQQIVAHIDMLAHLRASRPLAGSELQQVIQQGEQMTEQHLAQARQIMQQIDRASQGEGAQTTQRPGAETQR